jgi:arginyl-tRNA synthetase
MQTTTISTHIIEVISKVVAEITQASITVELEHPANADHGDYSTNIALTTFKHLSAEEKQQFGSPRKFADELAQRIEQQTSTLIVKSVTVAGPGFINFHIADEELVNYVVSSAANQFTELLEKPALKEKVAIVEYSSPNIAKPFTIGHLRSTIIGNAVANIYEAIGYTVFRDNHLGDWGTQFGKQIYAFLNIPLYPTGQRSNEEVLETSAEPVKDLVQLYIEFHALAEQKPEIEDEARAWFKKLEEGDAEARRIWQKCIDWSLKEFRQIYQRLGVSFTENNGIGYGESFFEDKMGPVLEELNKKNLLKESEGAQLVFLEEEKLPPLMIVKKDGATLYATRDLATDKFRRGNVERYGKEPLVINEVGAEQAEYFQQLFAVEYRLGWYKPGERVHVKHGHFRFQDKKMSTRKGNVIWLSDVLDEAVKRAEGNEVIGLGALKWNDLKRSAHLDVVFNWEEILSMEGNSGPYMQYAYTRCASILRKAESATEKTLVELDKGSIGDEERQLLRVLIQYPEVIERAANEYAPHHICTYLFELAQRFNSFYHQRPVLQAEGNERVLRLALTSSVANTLQHGLKLLGIDVPEKM